METGTTRPICAKETLYQSFGSLTFNSFSIQFTNSLTFSFKLRQKSSEEVLNFHTTHSCSGYTRFSVWNSELPYLETSSTPPFCRMSRKVTEYQFSIVLKPRCPASLSKYALSFVSFSQNFPKLQLCS